MKILSYLIFMVVMCNTATSVCANCNSSVIFVYPVDNHATINQNYTLFCNYTAIALDPSVDDKRTRRWYGGPDKKPIMSDSGISANLGKYQIKIVHGGYYLTILNLTDDDLNVTYECSVGFDICMIMLNSTFINFKSDTYTIHKIEPIPHTTDSFNNAPADSSSNAAADSSSNAASDNIINIFLVTVLQMKVLMYMIHVLF